MKHEADIGGQKEPESLADAIERARVSYAAGQGVEHRVVAQWLMTWGKPGRQPFGGWLSSWNG